MWHEDEQVKRIARVVVTLIADRHGGQSKTFKVVKLKCRTPALLHHELAHKVREEIKVLPVDGLALWTTITRLLKENIVELAEDRLRYWLEIPQVKSLMSILMSGTITFENQWTDSRHYDLIHSSLLLLAH